MHLWLNIWSFRGSDSYASWFMFRFIDLNVCSTHVCQTCHCWKTEQDLYGAPQPILTSNIKWGLGSYSEESTPKCFPTCSFHRHVVVYVLHVQHQLANELLIKATLPATSLPSSLNSRNELKAHTQHESQISHFSGEKLWSAGFRPRDFRQEPNEKVKR